MPFVVPLDIIPATKRKVAYMPRGASMHAHNVLVFSGAFYVQACIYLSWMLLNLKIYRVLLRVFLFLALRSSPGP